MRKNVLIRDNYEEMSREAADVIYEVIEKNPEAAIVIATGHSPRLAYRMLAEKVRENQTDVSRLTIIKLDEWAGLDADNEATCEYFIRKEILEPFGIDEKQYLHFAMNTGEEEAECRRIEEAYQNLSQIDLVILGIGMNGHLGLNEPGEELIGPAHTILLDDKTKTHELLSHTEKKVVGGLTLGMEDLFRGQKILLLADGKEKEKGLEYYLNDVITTKVPVSLLKLHRNCQCIVNRESFPVLEQQ
ncbi:MAG: 6-phosphogluconolactonase [Fusicatenibacter sp.]|nr:6-phosphogluconolactonase [Fusicatenibacter sp.]